MPVLQGYEYERLATGHFVAGADRVWEGHRMATDKVDGKPVLVTAGVLPSPILDVSWLKAASEVYDISPNIRDYVFSEVPANNADLPNRNMDAFPYSELVKYRPILGRVAYKSYVGKMTSKNHDNRDPRRSKGACFDSYMDKINGRWHTKVIAGWCRQKDPKLAEYVLKNKGIGYSMACLIGGAKCSACGTMSLGSVSCKHINGGLGKGTLWQGQLVYENLVDLNFWELAQVDDRADLTLCMIGRKERYREDL